MSGERLLHATAAAVATDADGPLVGALLTGPSGAGKSDLALRLVDGCRFGRTRLVADDQTLLRVEGGRLKACAPAATAGRLEIRGLGIVETPHIAEIEIAAAFDLARPPDRLPRSRTETILEGADPVPTLALAPFESSAPFKALRFLQALRRL